jgi:hypothetical protein
MGDVVRHQVQPNVPADAQTTPEERQRIHEQLHAPGRATLDATGYHVEQTRQATSTPSAAEMLADRSRSPRT